MALITPEELIVLLDLPADTQPADRAQLVCTLVLDKVTDIAGAALVAPYPSGAKAIALTAAARLYDNPVALRSSTIDDVTQVYAEGVVSVLSDQDREDLSRIFGSGIGTAATAPRYSFPEWDWSWTNSTTSTLSD